MTMTNAGQPKIEVAQGPQDAQVNVDFSHGSEETSCTVNASAKSATAEKAMWVFAGIVAIAITGGTPMYWASVARHDPSRHREDPSRHREVDAKGTTDNMASRHGPALSKPDVVPGPAESPVKIFHTFEEGLVAATDALKLAHNGGRLIFVSEFPEIGNMSVPHKYPDFHDAFLKAASTATRSRFLLAPAAVDKLFVSQEGLGSEEGQIMAESDLLRRAIAANDRHQLVERDAPQMRWLSYIAARAKDGKSLTVELHFPNIDGTDDMQAVVSTDPAAFDRIERVSTEMANPGSKLVALEKLETKP